ncbi:MAG: hypothetical protein IJ709_02330 [Selenomonas sp.]|nr:hypothetical protein [Selenomonas sp.]
MSIDINVHITADSGLVNAISDFAGCLAVISAAQAGNANMHLPEKTVEPPQAPAKPAEKAKATKNTKAEEKPLTGEPVSSAKAKEINDLVKEPKSKKAEEKTEAPNPDAQIDKGELPELRKKMRAYTDKNADGKENIKKWLAEHGVARVSEILNKDLPSFLEVLKDA